MPCLNHPAILDDLIVCWRCRQSFCRNCSVELQSYFFCPNCKPLQVRDILAGTDMVTPDYASHGKRFAGWLIDGLIKYIVGTMVNLGAQLGLMLIVGNRSVEVSMLGTFFGFILSQALEMSYEALMLSKNKGQTLGKMLVGIRVVTLEGSPISMQQAWWRAGFRTLLNFSTCTCFCMAWLLDGSFVFGSERTTLHDLVAQTRVVNVN